MRVLQFLAEKTTIPAPKVVSWGTCDESPQNLGPFIIMEFVDGTCLATLMKQPTQSEKDEVILATEVDEKRLDYVYEQLASYMLQLSRLDFDAIGAISKDEGGGTWMVKDRPLTHNMNELASVVSNYPINTFAVSPFTSSESYFQHLANDNFTHLHTQRNIASSPQDAKSRFLARHSMQNLIANFTPTSSTGKGPFNLFCDDLQPSNMLADSATWRITCVLDWEFTNSMPAQFSRDAPW